MLFQCHKSLRGAASCSATWILWPASFVNRPFVKWKHAEIETRRGLPSSFSIRAHYRFSPPSRTSRVRWYPSALYSCTRWIDRISLQFSSVPLLLYTINRGFIKKRWILVGIEFAFSVLVSRSKWPGLLIIIRAAVVCIQPLSYYSLAHLKSVTTCNLLAVKIVC